MTTFLEQVFEARNRALLSRAGKDLPDDPPDVPRAPTRQPATSQVVVRPRTAMPKSPKRRDVRKAWARQLSAANEALTNG